MYPYRRLGYTYNITFSHQAPFPGPYNVQPGNPQLAVVPQQQVGNRRQTRVHYTNYDRDLIDSQICRCATPENHGDAYSYPDVNNHAQYDGIRILDLQGREIQNDEYFQRCLDILRKDFVNSGSQTKAVRAQVLHPDTIQVLHDQRETLRRAEKGGQVRDASGAVLKGVEKAGLPHDVIWYGPVNPKDCRILPPPEQCEGTFIGASRGWNPVTGRAVNGPPMTGREAYWGQRGYGRQGFSRRRYH